jgi:hypothetical protein
MSNPGKGGRGKVAPYATTHYRIPEPIKLTVERFASMYRILVGAEDLEASENLIKSVNNAISNLGETEQELNLLKAVLAEAKNKIEKLESEKEFAINNLLPAFSLLSREGVKMREMIATAIPEIRNYPEFLASNKRKVNK